MMLHLAFPRRSCHAEIDYDGRGGRQAGASPRARALLEPIDRIPRFVIPGMIGVSGHRLVVMNRLRNVAHCFVSPTHLEERIRAALMALSKLVEARNGEVR